MARTAIVTSQPEVACAICARRLLRGEQPDTFVADERVHVVCALCADRARQAGWVRAAEPAALAQRSHARRRSSGSLRELLRRWRGGEEHERASRPLAGSRRAEGAAERAQR